MTSALCSKTCAKGPLHWLMFYLPTLTLLAVTFFLYYVYLVFFILTDIHKNGGRITGYMSAVIITFHILFGMYLFSLYRTWSTPAGRLPDVSFVCSLSVLKIGFFVDGWF
jgi:hypothetical protein